MLGRGLGELITRLLIDKINSKDREILETFYYNRDLGREEELK